MLKLVEFCFEDENGEKIVVEVPDGYRLTFNKPSSETVTSANLIAGAILAGASTITQAFRSTSDTE